MAPRARKRGGAAIAAGGFGCVFRPALRCQPGSPASSKYKASDVSKLMARRDANEEMQELGRVMPVLALIPNADKYFVGVGGNQNFYACTPAPLTTEDRVHYSRCRPLIRRGYTVDTINDKLEGLRVINQSDGGIEVNEAWGYANHAGHGHGAAAMADFTNGFKALNAGLMQLLVHGVVPLNRMGVLHGDLKASNVLVDSGPAAPAGRNVRTVLENMTHAQAANTDVLACRIIDWGLAMYFKGAPPSPLARLRQSIPESLRIGKYTLFNMPITAILFEDDLQRVIKKLVREFLPPRSGRTGRALAMRNVANRIYMIHLSSVDGHGHDDYLAQILGTFFYGVPVTANQQASQERDRSPQGIIIDYLAAALDAYVEPDGTFRRMDYFQDVFRHNCDVYGLLTCYLPLVEVPADVPQAQTWSRNLVSNGVVRMLAEYCYGPTYAARQIPIREVYDTCMAIGRLAPARRATTSGPPVRPSSSAPLADAPWNRRPARQASPRAEHPAAAAAPVKQKRCPKGTRRNKKTGLCVKTGAAKPAPRARASAAASKRKRCPKGTRRDTQTGECARTVPAHGSSVRTVSAGRRCPRGYARNKQTGKCHRTRKK